MALRETSISAVAALAAAALLALPAHAQSNSVPGIDVALGQLGDINQVGRTGTYPNGTSAAAMSTTSCNFGSVEVPWFAPMDAEHPFISFLVTREDRSGRIFQISDRSYVKHGFFALADNQCGLGCSTPAQFGQYLGVGCSDTYGISNNSDNYYLAPPAEIDPWLGEWDPFCSLFDLGLSGSTCDGGRSYSHSQANGLGPIGNRIHLDDQDLIDGGQNAVFAYQAYYVIGQEADGVRGNNLGWSRMSADWTGTKWNLDPTTTMVHGSILESWDGATVTSASNAGDDGRVYVAVKVTGPNQGKWHYEYALHNRDNSRAISEFRVPICPSAAISGLGFRDIDDDANNQWTSSVLGGEVVFSTDANALEWNTIYNFWFDADVAPEAGTANLGEFRLGVGANQFGVPTTAPLRRIAFDLGPGCSLSGTPPTLHPHGDPGVPEIGNTNFAILAVDQAPGSVGFLYGSGTTAVVPIAPTCNAYLGGVFGVNILLYSQGLANANGRAVYPLPVPNNPSYEGVRVKLQAVVINIGGPFAGVADISSGLEIRVGSATTGCN
ncbi:MAG: hypothetical protein R3F34_19200 [Planctomycetota bacterium]